MTSRFVAFAALALLAAAGPAAGADATGQHLLFEHRMLLDDGESTHGRALLQDPRTSRPMFNGSFEHNGETWTVWKMPEDGDPSEGKPGALFYQNKEKGYSTYTDPRSGQAKARPPPMVEGDDVEFIQFQDDVQKGGLWEIGFVIVFPLALLVAGVSWRISYLYKYNPEYINPTRQRKQRKRRGMGPYGLSRTKARGKTSQDGKGGRSANS